LEANVRRADGTLIATELTLAPMLQAHAGGIVCNIHDISERKQVEQDLRRALETEKELGEIKSRFISMASHEFRTPLAVVLSSSELLKLYADRMSDERRNEHYNIIETSIKNLTRLIDDVLTIGRVDSGRMEFNPQPLDLAPFCQALADETMVAFPNSAPVQFTPKSPCPEAVLDHRLLRQLLSNLLSNAIKYTPDLTPVEFTLQCTGDSAIFAVLDHGMGMSHKDMHHLFEAFYRSPQVSEIPGTGLGLAIMKRAVDLHGGTVDFTSTLGNGTKVVVTLPLKPVLLERAAAPEQAAEF
jgi:signal transduction histidine kinase